MSSRSTNQKVDDNQDHGTDPGTHEDTPDIRAQMAELPVEVRA